MFLIRGRWRRLIGGGVGQREIIGIGIETGIGRIDDGRRISAAREGEFSVMARMSN
jgi:hypothetical protein